MSQSDSPATASNGRRSIIRAGAATLALAAADSGMVAAQTARPPRRGGTLRVSSGGDPPDFDMHQSSTYLTLFLGAPCYSTLMRVDPADYNRLIPDLAEKADVSPDGKTVTFHLRDGVLFHNGMTMTADDVAYSLERIRKPPKGMVSPRRGLVGNIQAIEVRDARTVVVNLAHAQPDFLFLVSHPGNVIVPKKIAEPLDAQGLGMKRQIIGTGPFRLAQAVDGQIYEMTRFDKYFGPAPYLDRIQFFPIKGEVERSAALQGKRIDACFFFTAESLLTTLRKVPGINALRRPTPTYINLIPNVQRKPFDDPRVREALSLAIDRDAFIKTAGPLAGASFHSIGLMPPGSPYSLTQDELRQFGGYDSLPGFSGNVAANRQRAMALLEQAGVPRGFKVVIPTRGDLSVFRDAAINVAAQLKTVGLDASVDVREPAAFYAIENKGDFQMVVHSMAMGGSTPDQILGEGYTSYGGRNYGLWKDDMLDKVFQEQSRESDPRRRVELIRQFQLAFLKTHYQINLAWVGYGAAHSSAMHGWIATPDFYANMQLGEVWLEA